MMQTVHSAIRQSEFKLKAAISLVDSRVLLVKVARSPSHSASTGDILAQMLDERDACKHSGDVFRAASAIKSEMFKSRDAARTILADAHKTATAWLDLADHLEGRGAMPVALPEHFQTLARKMLAGIRAGAIPNPSDEIRRHASHALSALANATDKHKHLGDTAAIALHSNIGELYRQCAENPAFDDRSRRLLSYVAGKKDAARDARRARFIETKRRIRMEGLK